GLGLVLQGVDRLTISAHVYLAVGQWPKRMKNVRKLCRRLGLGLIIVAADRADVVLDPLPYRPRVNKRKAGRLLGEHQRRVGYPTRGGRRPRFPLMPASRQEALRGAELWASHGPMGFAALRGAAAAPRGARIVQQDVYGWFERVERGVYAITPAGRRALEVFA